MFSDRTVPEQCSCMAASRVLDLVVVCCRRPQVSPVSVVWFFCAAVIIKTLMLTEYPINILYMMQLYFRRLVIFIPTIWCCLENDGFILSLVSLKRSSSCHPTEFFHTTVVSHLIITDKFKPEVYRLFIQLINCFMINESLNWIKLKWTELKQIKGTETAVFSALTNSGLKTLIDWFIYIW